MTFVSLNPGATTPAPTTGFSSTQSATSGTTGDTSIGGLFGALLDKVAGAVESTLGLPQISAGAQPAADATAIPTTIDAAVSLTDAASAQATAAAQQLPNAAAAGAQVTPAPAVPETQVAAAAQLDPTGHGQFTLDGAQIAYLTAPPADAAAPADLTAAAPAPAVPASPALPTPFGNLSDSLAQLDKALADNKPVDPALLDKLNKALDAVAGLLGLTPQAPIVPAAVTTPAPAPATSSPADALATTPVASPAPAGADPKLMLADLSQKLNDLAGKLSVPSTDLTTNLGGQAADLAAKLQAIGQQLGSNNLSPDTLAKLGLAATPASPETSFIAALNSQLSTAPVVKNAPAPQLFSAPQLKVPQGSSLAPPSTAKLDAAAPSPQPAAPAASALAPAPHAVEKAKVTADAKPADKAAATTAPAAPLGGDPVKAADPIAQPSAPATPAPIDPALQAAKPAQVAYPAAPTAVNLPQMAYEIVRHVQDGASRFQIRLDPPELGRIDVKMHVDPSGNLHARMTVDRVETLDLLKRDSASLERALSQAGVDGGKTNLEFSMRQNPFARQDQQGGQSAPQRFGDSTAGATEEPTPVSTTKTLYRGTLSASGVNIFV